MSSDEKAEIEGQAISKSRQYQTRRPPHSTGRKRYGNPEREVSARPVVNYPPPLAVFTDDWLTTGTTSTGNVGGVGQT